VKISCKLFIYVYRHLYIYIYNYIILIYFLLNSDFVIFYKMPRNIITLMRFIMFRESTHKQ